MSGVLRLLDQLRGRAITGWLRRVPGTERLYRASRGQLVDRRLRFGVNELMRRPGAHPYRLRQGGRILVRHHMRDVDVLDELFWWDFYDPPPEVASYLAARPAPRLVDLGAFTGLFGVWALRRWPGARLLSVEADGANADLCARTIGANGAGRRWRLVRGFAATAPGTVPFRAGQGAQSHAAAPDERGAVSAPAVDVLPWLLDADFVKIDIEGAEWPLLADQRMAGVPGALVLEYHPEGAPGSDPQNCASALLEKAGFTVRHTESFPAGNGLLWASR